MSIGAAATQRTLAHPRPRLVIMGMRLLQIIYVNLGSLPICTPIHEGGH